MQKNTIRPEIMSFKIIGHVIHNSSLPPTQKLVLIVLADFFNEKSGKAWPSQNTLCDVTGLSRRSINRALKALKKDGYITIWKERSASQYPHNVYRVNHVPHGHMAEELNAKNNQAQCHEEPNLCASEAHQPLGTLNIPLDENSNNLRPKESKAIKPSQSGPPRTPADFMSRSHFQRTFYAWNNPDLMRGLKAKGLQYDVRLDRPDGYHPERFKEGV
jgi:DNA-binding transcriptional ArsR family regulator